MIRRLWNWMNDPHTSNREATTLHAERSHRQLMSQSAQEDKTFVERVYNALKAAAQQAEETGSDLTWPPPERSEVLQIIKAIQVARDCGWWDNLGRILCLARPFRRFPDDLATEWAALIEQITGDLLDDVHFPHQFHHYIWREVTGYSHFDSDNSEKWREAFLRLCTARRMAVTRDIAAALLDVAQGMMDAGQPECIAWFKEAYDLGSKLPDARIVHSAALGLGSAYLEQGSLELADKWVLRSMEFIEDDDHSVRAICLCRRSEIARERWHLGRQARRSPDGKHLEEALAFCGEALSLAPPSSGAWGLVQKEFGMVYDDQELCDEAIRHYKLAIDALETGENGRELARVEFMMAVSGAKLKSFDFADTFVSAAIDYFKTDDRCTVELEKAQKLAKELKVLRYRA